MMHCVQAAHILNIFTAIKGFLSSLLFGGISLWSNLDVTVYIIVVHSPQICICIVAYVY